MKKKTNFKILKKKKIILFFINFIFYLIYKFIKMIFIEKKIDFFKLNSFLFYFFRILIYFHEGAFAFYYLFGLYAPLPGTFSLLPPPN
jgi:hypothetical protein